MNRSYVLGLKSLTTAQRSSLLSLVDKGVVDPCVEGVSPALCRLWYRHLPVGKQLCPAIAEVRDLLLRGGGIAWHQRQVASQLTRSLNCQPLNAFLRDWTSVTNDPLFLEAISWMWLFASGKGDDDPDADEEGTSVSVSKKSASERPATLLPGFGMFRKVMKVNSMHPCELVDRVALPQGWWSKEDESRKTAFICWHVYEHTVEHEWISSEELANAFDFDISGVVDGLVTDGTLKRLSNDGVTTAEIWNTSTRVRQLILQCTDVSPWSTDPPPLSLNEGQKKLFARIVLEGGCATLCCAPAGTGKTYTASILAEHCPGTTLCLAPTWKAIHVLRSKVTCPRASFDTVQGFVVKQEPIAARFVIVDETSMLTMGQIRCILQAVVYRNVGAKEKTSILFLGDDVQLPCIGRGFPIRDIRSVITTLRLETCMRVHGEHLLQAAHNVRDGLPVEESGNEVVLHPARDVVDACVSHYPDQAFPPWHEDYVQIITPQNKHVDEINAALQEKLTGSGPRFSNCYVGDPVRMSVNTDSYKNGDEGVLVEVQPARVPASSRKRKKKSGEDDLEGRVRLKDDRVVVVKDGHVQPAYACTVHKVQGSEYPVVCSALFFGTHPSLKIREMMYTAVTRARKALWICGHVVMVSECHPLVRRTVFDVV